MFSSFQAIDARYVLKETRLVFMSLLNTFQCVCLVLKTTPPPRIPPTRLLPVHPQQTHKDVGFSCWWTPTQIGPVSFSLGKLGLGTLETTSLNREHVNIVTAGQLCTGRDRESSLQRGRQNAQTWKTIWPVRVRERERDIHKLAA